MEVHRNSTIAILLGASTYIYEPKLSHIAFQNAAETVLSYFLSNEGLNINKNDILWLFDTSSSPDDIDQELKRFLEDRKNGVVTDLIIYYVGHGAIIDDQYYLTIKRSRSENHGFSSLSFRWLSKTIYYEAKTLRVLWIIDACYSGESKRFFLSEDGLMAKQVGGFYARAGVSLLCSSSSTRRSLVEDNGELPAFTSYLMKRLNEGVKFVNRDHFNTRELHESLCDDIATDVDDTPIPEIHSPVQVEGTEVASHRIFPNHYGRSASQRFTIQIEQLEQVAAKKQELLEEQYRRKKKEEEELHITAQRLALEKQTNEIQALEYERKRQIDETNIRLAIEIEDAKKRLSGWSPTEIQDLEELVMTNSLLQDDFVKWVKWMSDRAINLNKEFNHLIIRCREREKKVFVPNGTYIQNMKDAMADGRHSEADYLQSIISKSKKLKNYLNKMVSHLSDRREQCRKNDFFFQSIIRDPEKAKIIFARIVPLSQVTFEEWLLYNFSDHTVPRTRLNKILEKFGFNLDRSDYLIDSLEKQLKYYQSRFELSDDKMIEREQVGLL